jgi:protein-L-isoaspartate(D-aspartate) O-methyltransferase
MASSIEEIRNFYAAYVLGQAEVNDRRLARAFQVVPREKFCGNGPWRVHTSNGYIDTPSDDPRYLYQDILIAIDPGRGVNNGQPSLHARSIASAAPKIGNHVLHIGAGTGYYSAILAELVGATGKVIALEIDNKTAERAREYLSDKDNVTVVNRSGSEAGLPISDVIYVNAGAPLVITHWLDALADGGRLIFPLTTGFEMGGMFLVTHHADQFAARFTSRAAFIPCIGTEDSKASDKLRQAYRSDGWADVKSLVRGSQPPDSTSWLAGDGWWISTRPLPTKH